MLGVIPARLGSTRLPRKPLIDLAGHPLIEWVWRRAVELEVFSELVVATDAAEVAEVVDGFGGRATLTRADHPSGTDRVAEVARRPEFDGFEVVVNLQGDEPFMDRRCVTGAVRRALSGWDVGTAAVPITDRAEWEDAAVVKVVRNDQGGALYFSRAPIPHVRDGGFPPGDGEGESDCFLRHIGIYAFARPALEAAVDAPVRGLERLEGLEQLRWLAAGLRIGVAIVEESGYGIDTEQDVRRADRRLRTELDTT